MKNKNIIYIALVTAIILLIPLVAKWPWTGSDFIFAGVLIFGSGLVYELVSRRSNTVAYRVAVGLAVLSSFLLIWINAAVGIIGDGDLDSPNAMYLGVILLGLIGAGIVRFEPKAMARVLFAMAIALALVPILALIFFPAETTSWAPGVLKVFVLNTVFVLLFAGSGLLFRKAGK